MKSTSVFLFGIFLGVTAAVVIEKIRRENNPEDVERLSRRVAEHLNQLETRIDKLVHGAEAV